MSLVVNTNVASLVASNNVRQTTGVMEQAMERLSSGKRINSGADDAAGTAIASRMTSQIQGLNQSIRNSNDAISLAQTAEGALVEIENMLQRMRELAVQAETGTNTADDREYMDDEFEQLKTEITRIAQATQFNSQDLFTTTGGATTAFTFAIGYNSATSDELGVTISGISSFIGGAGETTDIGALASVPAAITAIDNELDVIRAERGDMGSVINRLNFTIDNMSGIAVNTEAARSRIVDSDFAAESAALSRAQILQQAGTAMLAQANSSQQTVLALLT
jgi:flagellin